MGEFLVEVAAAGVQVLIETHSDHILNGVRRAVKKVVLPPDGVLLHFFRPRDESGQSTSAQVESLQSTLPETLMLGRRVSSISSTRTRTSLQVGDRVGIFLNNQSLHGQFHNRSDFRSALGRVMAMRRVAREFDRDIHCDGGILGRAVSSQVAVREAIAWLTLTRGVLRWYGGHKVARSGRRIVNTAMAIGSSARTRSSRTTRWVRRHIA